MVRPEEGIIAATDGTQFETFNFYEKQYEDKVRGWWYSNPYQVKEHTINGRVSDLAFNDANHELVVIFSNGKLLFCHETYCRYYDNLEIITNFNISAYDFTNCRVSEKIQEKLRQNGAII